MDLSALEFDAWFQRKNEELNKKNYSVTRIIRVDRDRYLVRQDEQEIHAELRGKRFFTAESREEIPCVGDWVLVEFHNKGTLAIIQDLLPRKSFLRRKTAGKKVDYQILAANIDVAFIIQSCDFDFNLRRLERYMVMVQEVQIEPVILLSKSDLVTAEHLEQCSSQIRQSHINADIIAFSNRTGAGIGHINNILTRGKTYCLLGSSGVGKTSLLNNLLGQEIYDTYPVREKDGRGRHITAHRQLHVLANGALLIDTPGLRELGMLAVDTSIDDSFADIRDLAEKCRFNDCTHQHETGCAVLGAINDGDLDEGRYQNYLKLKKESEYNEMSYVEKRRKDKQFGRMVKSIMKYKKRNEG